MVALISTDFTQPDGLLSTPDWLLVGGSTGYPTVTSGEAGAQSISGTNNTYSAIYNAVLDADDMEATAVVGTPAVGATGTSISYSIIWLGVANQSTSGSSGTVTNGAYLQFRPGQSSGANSLSIGTVIGGAATTRANAASTVNFSAGDTVTLRRIGDTYMAIVNGTVVCAWSDTSNLLARGSSNRSVGIRFASGSATNRSSTYTSFTAQSLTVPSLVDTSFASTNTASADVTCSYPTGSASGDLLVMFAGYQRSPTLSGTLHQINTPSGWTLVESDDSKSGTSGMSVATFYRFRGAETSVTVSASNATSEYGSVQIHAYRGSIDQTNPIDASALGYSTSSGSIVARTFPTATTVNDECALSYFMYMEKTSSGSLTFAGAGPLNGSNPIERIDAYSGTNGDLLFGSATAYQYKAGSTGTCTVQPNLSANETFMEVVAIRLAKNLSLSSADAAGATESTPTITQPAQTDSAGATESTPSIRPATQADAAGATDAATLKANLTGAEAAGATDVASPVRAFGTAADAAGATETASVQVSGVTDGAGGTDAATVKADLAGADAAGATDAATLKANVSDADQSGPVVDLAGASNAASDADTISATEAVGPLGVAPLADGSGGTDAASVKAQSLGTDAAGATESTAKVAPANQPDAAGATESTPKIAPAKQSDAAGVSESAYIIVNVFASDSASATDGTAPVISFIAPTDSFGAGEDAFKARSGILDTPRLLTVPKDDRRFKVEREIRTVTVAPDVRRLVIGKDLAPRSKMPHKDSRTLGIPADNRVFIAEREE